MENKIVYQGKITDLKVNPFLGQIVIDKKTGLIDEVVMDKIKYDADRTFSDSSLIFPGMGDIHIHAREDETGNQVHKEEYRTAGNAALNGGVVHTSAMPNTPNPIVDSQTFNWHRDRISEIEHPVSILNYVGIGKGTKPIGEPGEHMYKAFFGKSVGDLTFYDEHELEEALKHYEGHNVSFHVEYEPFVEASSDGLTHTDRRPIGAVNHGLKLLLPLIEKYKIDAKLCHWSIGGQSFGMIEEHRNRAVQKNLPYTTIEVSPLHLYFDNSMTDIDPSLWLKVQMNPAIQTPEHRLQLIEGLKNGFIDFLATDHAPHTIEEKHSAFTKLKKIYPDLTNEQIARKLEKENPELFKKTCCENGMSGAPWLDTYSNICAWLMKENGFKPQDIFRVASYNPGMFVNEHLERQFKDQDFGKGFGKIEQGYVGSLTILNTDKPQTITREKLQTKVGWSALEERTFSGGLEAVIIKGEDMTGKLMQ